MFCLWKFSLVFQQWIDLARLTGLQAHNDDKPPAELEQVSETINPEKVEAVPDSTKDRLDADAKPWEISTMECMTTRDEHMDDVNRHI